ncbi:unnamed protein product [Trichobilharzia regenti]|nr:unnamed protein product [Trichobilharzia regenti]
MSVEGYRKRSRTSPTLPEGFRGEAGPVLGYPNPVIIQSNESVKSNNPATHHQQPTAMETYFVQPRQVSQYIYILM